MHWIKSRFFDREQTDTTILKTTYKDNKWVDEGYHQTLLGLKDIDRALHDVYALGEWGVLSGLVFGNWESVTCPYSPDDFDQILAGQDFGFNHKNAIELIGLKDGNLYSFDELYLSQMTNGEIIELCEGPWPAE